MDASVLDLDGTNNNGNGGTQGNNGDSQEDTTALNGGQEKQDINAVNNGERGGVFHLYGQHSGDQVVHRRRVR